MALTRKQILDRIKALKLHGWGGACGAAAIEINKHVFGGRGRYVAGVNEYMLEEGHSLGHVVVLYDGRYYDSDGEIAEDDLLGWGMVDAEEYDFPKGAEGLADEAILIELESEAEVRSYFPWCDVVPRG
jgi:hypothetical protein